MAMRKPRQTKVKKETVKDFHKKTFEKTVQTPSGEDKRLSFGFKDLMEALNPALTKDMLLIPGFNCRLIYDDKGQYQPLYLDKKPALKFYHLTPYYEHQLVELLDPVIRELREFMQDIGADGEDINWTAKLSEIVPALVERLIGALQDYNITLAAGASIIAEASIKLARIYKCEDITEEDEKNCTMLSSEYFLVNVPADFILKYIVLPQYRKTAMADAISLFFSTIAKYLSIGAENLIQKQTSSTIVSM